MADTTNWTILGEGLVGDGYDVRFLMAGEAHVLHFAIQPSQNEMNEAITRFCEQRIASIGSDQEEGNDIKLFDQ